VMRMRGGRRLPHLSPVLSEALRALARGEGATLFMAVLAAVAALLHRLSGQEKLILGANNANRNRPEIEAVLGPFLTQVPFPIDLTGDPTFRELLARVRRSALGAYAHQDLPFGKLVEAIQPERDASRPPLVQALVLIFVAAPALIRWIYRLKLPREAASVAGETGEGGVGGVGALEVVHVAAAAGDQPGVFAAMDLGSDHRGDGHG